MGPQPLETEPKADAAVHVILDQRLWLGLFQSKVVKASTSNTERDKVVRSKLVTPGEKLANMQSDFEEVWEGKTTGDYQLEWIATES